MGKERKRETEYLAQEKQLSGQAVRTFCLPIHFCEEKEDYLKSFGIIEGLPMSVKKNECQNECDRMSVNRMTLD